MWPNAQRTGRHRSNKSNRNPIIQTPATRIQRASEVS
nr:MAG TPA: hypothetical protein [Caudoviricetes sp.]